MLDGLNSSILLHTDSNFRLSNSQLVIAQGLIIFQLHGVLKLFSVFEYEVVLALYHFNFAKYFCTSKQLKEDSKYPRPLQHLYFSYSQKNFQLNHGAYSPQLIVLSCFTCLKRSNGIPTVRAFSFTASHLQLLDKWKPEAPYG